MDDLNRILIAQTMEDKLRMEAEKKSGGKILYSLLPRDKKVHSVGCNANVSQITISGAYELMLCGIIKNRSQVWRTLGYDEQGVARFYSQDAVDAELQRLKEYFGVCG